MVQSTPPTTPATPYIDPDAGDLDFVELIALAKAVSVAPLWHPIADEPGFVSARTLIELPLRDAAPSRDVIPGLLDYTLVCETVVIGSAAKVTHVEVDHAWWRLPGEHFAPAGSRMARRATEVLDQNRAAALSALRLVASYPFLRGGELDDRPAPLDSYALVSSDRDAVKAGDDSIAVSHYSHASVGDCSIALAPAGRASARMYGTAITTEGSARAGLCGVAVALDSDGVVSGGIGAVLIGCWLRHGTCGQPSTMRAIVGRVGVDRDVDGDPIAADVAYRVVDGAWVRAAGGAA